MRWSRALPIMAVGVLASSGAFAMFRAADLVIVPVAASIAGLNGSNWRSDIEITNVDTVNIDVEIVLLECCGSDNTTWFANIANHLGGRSTDGFGHVDTNLADIPPGRTVYINDVIGTDFALSNTKGALLIFAYQANTLSSPPGGVPKNIVVNTRSYTFGTDSTGKVYTYGQQIPGLPWYYYLDPGKKSMGLDHVVFSGLREDASYRTAIGLVNISDRTTSLDVLLTLTGRDGTQIAQETVVMPPLSHDQEDQAIINLFGKSLTDAIQGASLTISVPLYISGAAQPAPALISYISRIDNVSNDPIYVEQAFTKPLPWDCVFNGNCSSMATGMSLAPLQPGAQATPQAPVPPQAPHLRPPSPRAR
ncbi:MAG TPA: hypothetical protein VMT19_01035 [Thermoanaerobaculaceae bacterium]|nr:hypothetical protein [Thermoanaerobaculaceae bacterium]